MEGPQAFIHLTPDNAKHMSFEVLTSLTSQSLFTLI